MTPRRVCAVCGHPIRADDSTYCTAQDGRIVVYHLRCVVRVGGEQEPPERVKKEHGA